MASTSSAGRALGASAARGAWQVQGDISRRRGQNQILIRGPCASQPPTEEEGRAEMVFAKKTTEWHAVDAVTTPSQARAYIDSCKEWLLAAPVDEEDEIDIHPQEIPVAQEPSRQNNNGLLREHIHEHNVFECFLCATECRVADGRVVTANPFTRSQCILFCTRCIS